MVGRQAGGSGMSGSSTRTTPDPNPARRERSMCSLLSGRAFPGRKSAGISGCIAGRSIASSRSRVEAAVRRSRCGVRGRDNARRRQRIELVHELAQKKISGAEIARRPASQKDRLPGSASGAAADIGPGAIVPHNSVLNNASNEPPRSGHCTIRDAAKRRSRSFSE